MPLASNEVRLTRQQQEGRKTLQREHMCMGKHACRTKPIWVT